MMTDPHAIWLVANENSGSNTPAALEELLNGCSTCGFQVDRRIAFPDEDLPTPAKLDAAGVGSLAVYAGDGTINALVTGLYGWSGQIIVLPGGTMNLFAKRLHGDSPAETILRRIGAGACRRVRPQVARCAQGDAMAGLLAGPGTAWYAVREAMRDTDLAGMAESANNAMAETTSGPMVHCADPSLGRSEGYPLIEITPGGWGLQLDGFYADSAGDFFQQAWALVRRQFREGPHERLALVDSVTVITDSTGETIGLLIDGEPAEGGLSVEFTVAECEVDLVATTNGN